MCRLRALLPALSPQGLRRIDLSFLHWLKVFQVLTFQARVLQFVVCLSFVFVPSLGLTIKFLKKCIHFCEYTHTTLPAVFVAK